MSAHQYTQQCYPREIDFGVLDLDGKPMVFPAPEPDHEHCPKGQHLPGVLGGWHCPCPCHFQIKEIENDPVG